MHSAVLSRLKSLTTLQCATRHQNSYNSPWQCYLFHNCSQRNRLDIHTNSRTSPDSMSQNSSMDYSHKYLKWDRKWILWLWIWMCTTTSECVKRRGWWWVVWWMVCGVMYHMWMTPHTMVLYDCSGTLIIDAIACISVTQCVLMGITVQYSYILLSGRYMFF